MKRSSRVFDFLIGVGLIGIAGLAIVYFLINERFEWIPEKLLELARDPQILKRPPAKKCSECHEDIYEAWKDSRHSVSWTSDNFIEESENRT